MKQVKKLLTVLAFTAVIPMTHADAYLGGNMMYLNYTEDDIDVDLGALYLRGGYQFNEWAALEARIGTGIRNDTTTYMGTLVHIDANDIYGAYFVAGIPNDSVFYPYAVAGYTHAELEASLLGFSDTSSDSDFSYGVGTDIRISDNVAANVELMRYMDKDGFEMDGLSAGIKYTFK